MFIGHYAPALLAAAAGPGAPRLGAMFVAAQLVDFAFFGLALVDVEHFRMVPGTTPQTSLDLYHMPYTHSLIGTIAFAALWAGAARLLGAGWRATMLGAAVVVSHWLLDLLVHLPDLTIAGTPPRFGLGLWTLPWIERPLELAITAGALAWYLRRTRPVARAAALPVTVLSIALLAAQMIDWFGPLPSRIVDPVPPTLPVTALCAFTALALLAWWVDRTRTGAGPAVRRL